MRGSGCVTLTTVPTATNPQPQRWSLATRIAFRFAVCYFPLYALCCGNATFWKTFPRIGDRLELLFWYPFKHLAHPIGLRVFHLTGTAARLHMGVSNDQALTWISVGAMLCLALVATLVWSLIDRSPSYPRLFLWFRLTLRICIASSMVIYGMLKLFPNQMGPPSLAVLNEPLGNTSPMTLLWTLVGLHPLYESIAGATELLCGVLVLFRRTALLGALLTAFVMSNVALYNFFFDVPVKLFATHLLLMAVVFIVPDAPALFHFFWRHTAFTPLAGNSPFTTQKARRIETFALAAWLVLAIAGRAAILAPLTARENALIAHPSPLTGIWHLDSATQSYITADGYPLTDISLEPNGRAMLRATDTALYRAVAFYDADRHTLELQPIGLTQSTTYSVAQPDARHLVLTPLRSAGVTGSFGTLTLTRVPTPEHYPLLERGFHWVNEWGLER